jgi:hypothetical protein
MKKYLLFLLIFTFTNCVTLKTKLSPDIKEFEHILGKSRSKELNHQIIQFEKEIKETYHTNSIEEALSSYISSADKSGEFSPIYNKNNKHILMSKSLKDEIWLKPDSCFLDDRFIICNYSYNNKMFQIKNILNNSKSYSVTDRIIFNKKGLYFKALKCISNNNKVVAEYINNLEISGNSSPALFAGWLFTKDTDLSDYFIERIIFIDIYLQNYN